MTSLSSCRNLFVTEQGGISVPNETIFPRPFRNNI